MKTTLLSIALLTYIGCTYPRNESRISENDSLKNILDAEKLRDEYNLRVLDSLAKMRKEWTISSYVDQFGDPTNEKHILTNRLGTFSNSATSNSDLYVRILVDKDAIGIFLHEYNVSRPAEGVVGSMTINLKNSDGKTLTVHSYSNWNHSGGIKIQKDRVMHDYTKLKNFLASSVGEVKVFIHDKYSSSYNFTIDCDGFKEAFNSI